jgi:hypothetical protein
MKPLLLILFVLICCPYFWRFVATLAGMVNWRIVGPLVLVPLACLAVSIGIGFLLNLAFGRQNRQQRNSDRFQPGGEGSGPAGGRFPDNLDSFGGLNPITPPKEILP